jgi:diguanylate cyclase (GGDEF)-like protein
MMTTYPLNILEKIKLTGELPSPKGIALEVISLTQREDTSNFDIVRLIGADPVLSIRVIKAANVLVSNSTRPVVTISDAVAVLGFRALRQLVMGIALIADHQSGPCKQFNYPQFWAHSLLTGIAVRYLTEQTKLAAAEEIFTLGLLGGVGRLTMASVYPKEFGSMLEHANSETLAQLYSHEREEFGFEETEVSSAILADMNFPPLFQRLIHDFPQPESSNASEGSREWQLMHMLHLAALMADVCLANKSSDLREVRKLRLAAASISIEEKTLISVSEKCAAEWPEWAALLNLGKRSIPSFAGLFDNADHDGEAELSSTAPVDNMGFKLRVLVVDDDRSTRMLIEAMLKSAGHHVATAATGVEALQKIKTERPQLVITDWVMPEMDGITLCREIRARSDVSDVYVIIVTAHEMPGKLVEAFEAGADDYIVKPITPKMFLARLRAGQRVVQLQEELAADRDQLAHYSAELSSANERLQQQALTDALTGLPNRRFAMDRVAQEWALSQRGERTLSCLMIDVDHFKRINDNFGHQVGDEALRLIADTLRQSARAQDVVCRYGGEEFMVICPDTKLADAFKCAERMRLSVESKKLKLQGGTELKMTISIGVAEKVEPIASVEKLLVRADNNLYAAKEAGRNRTVMTQ